MGSRLDPLGMVDLAARTAAGAVFWSERQIVNMLRSRLPNSESPPAGAENLDTRFQRLLRQNDETGSTSSRQELFHRIVDQLVPDEARILEALSDGTWSPLVHVYATAPSGLAGQVVLENMSSVAQTANLALPHLTPTYVSHLLSLGLVETGPEDESLRAEYDSLEDDTTVRRAVKKATQGSLPALVERHTLRLSGLGLELWAAANPHTV